MAAITGLSFIQHPTPFCENRFKFARLAANALSQICIALFFRILSCACWLVSSAAYENYKHRAKFTISRATHLLTYLFYGSHVVDFSINLSPKNGGKGIDELRKNFDSASVDKWVSTPSCNLDGLSYPSDGCCLGLSLDFIASYLKEQQEGGKPLDIIRALAPRYIEGAPDDAALAQIFYRACKPSQEELESLGKERISELSHKLFERIEKKWRKCAELVGDPEKFASSFFELCSESNEVDRELSLQTMSLLFLRDKKKKSIIAEKCGISLSQSHLYGTFNAETATHSDFNDCLQKIPSGVYFVTLRNAQASHAVAFIKCSEGPHFLFDPNFATFAFEPQKAAAEIWDIAHTFYLERGDCLMEFFPCSLVSS